MSALTHTLLPEPVAPAMSRCGMRARSTAYALPDTSRPRANVSLLVGLAHARVLEQLAEADDLADVVGDLDADHVAARDGRLDADRARGERHRQVVGERLDARQLDARVGPDLVLGHDRPGVGRRDRGRDLEAAQLLLDDPDVARVVERAAPDARGDARRRAARWPGSAQTRAGAQRLLRPSRCGRSATRGRDAARQRHRRGRLEPRHRPSAVARPPLHTVWLSGAALARARAGPAAAARSAADSAARGAARRHRRPVARPVRPRAAAASAALSAIAAAPGVGDRPRSRAIRDRRR